MSEPKFGYRIVTKDGYSTSFHIVDLIIIPRSNFELALAWFNKKKACQ